MLPQPNLLARIFVFAGSTYATTWIIHRYVKEKIAVPDTAGIIIGAAVGALIDRRLQQQAQERKEEE